VIPGIEHHGRLCRRDGRPANPGQYDLRFALHRDEVGKRSCWAEDHTSVHVAPGGFYSVLLGQEKPIKPSYFDNGARQLSVRILRKGEPEEETGNRTPFTGYIQQLGATTEALTQRIEHLEAAEAIRGAQTNPDVFDQNLAALEQRVQILENDRITDLENLVKLLAERLLAVDGVGQRLDRAEDRIEDIDGAEGDIVTLIERMHAVEIVAPQLFDYLADENPAMELEALEQRVLELERDNRLNPSRIHKFPKVNKA
jgi:exonuclease VII small subunit